MLLEQAADAQGSALKVEEKRVAETEAQRGVAILSANLAQLRLDNAAAQYVDHNALSSELAYYEEIGAWATAGSEDIELSNDTLRNWAIGLGIDPQKVNPVTYYDYSMDMPVTYNQEASLRTLMQLLTRKRNQLTRGYEEKNMQRQISELSSARQLADEQVNVADKTLDVAKSQRDLADLRLQQANAQLAFFNTQEFTPELWDNLAQAQREISHRYLDLAIGSAFLMERAFEFEYDTKINRVRFDYERSELHGLLAGDFLLADIDQFSYDRLLDTEKKVPVKVTISLADRYPYQFYRQFQKTGRIDFETFLDDFDSWYPGSHLRKLRQVEVVIEGLIGAQGIHGTLTNSGISYDRDREGVSRPRLQKPETMILSRYDFRNDGFVFISKEEDVLRLFENGGVATGWILEFPPDSNDIDYRTITNVHLVFYFDAYYSDRVANLVRAEMAATAVYEYSVGLGLKFQYPDEFFD